MIAYIRGNLESIEESGVILEAGGIGFFINTTGKVTEKLMGMLHEEVLLHTHLQILENERVLFGFPDKTELRNFKRLIAVNGVGPKYALSIMNLLSAEELYLAVQSGDAKTISKANGIGPKLAQRIVLECKDVLETGSDIPEELPDAGKGSGTAGTDSPHSARNDAIEAMEALGYSRTEALRAIRSIPDAGEKTVEELLSAALRKLG